MPDKKGEPTLMEQFDDADAHQRLVEEQKIATYSDVVSDGGMDPRDRTEPHKVSEPMNDLEAYRHLQKVEAERALLLDMLQELGQHRPTLGACNRGYYAEHGMLCDRNRNIGPCNCGWKEAEEAFAKAEKLLKEIK